MTKLQKKQFFVRLMISVAWVYLIYESAGWPVAAFAAMVLSRFEVEDFYNRKMRPLSTLFPGLGQNKEAKGAGQ